MHGGQDGLPLVLLAELAARPPTARERRGEHETPQVEVLLEVGQPVFHLVVVEVGLHVRDLDVRLRGGGGGGGSGRFGFRFKALETLSFVLEVTHIKTLFFQTHNVQ